MNGWYLQSDCISLFDEVESVSFVALADDQVAGPELLRPERLGDGHALVAVHGLEQLDAGEEVFVLAALVDGGFLHDVVEGLSVERPEHAVCEGADGRGSE